MKTIYDLNSILFEAMERISNPSLSGQALQDEKSRANAIKGLGSVMVNNFRLELDANKAELPPNPALKNESLPLGFRNNTIKELDK